jgi:O-acetyl-ADP-ribose deacetylase (regulator of RNase III)
MIEFKTGDILAEDADALVNTVNCVGFMGRGVALQFKKAWPDNFRAYAAACRRGEVKPGQMLVFDTGRLTPPRLIVNFPTKRHWRGKSRIEDIQSGLAALVREIRDRDIQSIALPPLGAGLGGLDWSEVKPLIVQALGDLPGVDVRVFEPGDAPVQGVGARTREVPAMTPGRAVLVGLMERYLAGLLDPFVSLLEVHKLMYFMQEAGEPLRLRVRKAPFGPYAENLRNVLATIDGYFISGYGVGGDAPDKELELVPGAVEDARAVLEGQPDSLARFERVAELIKGFESPFGLELLATVDWVMTREKAVTADEVAERTYAWDERKRRFSRHQLAVAQRALTEHGFASVRR